jgi:hypothetical protein
MKLANLSIFSFRPTSRPYIFQLHNLVVALFTESLFHVGLHLLGRLKLTLSATRTDRTARTAASSQHALFGSPLGPCAH